MTSDQKRALGIGAVGVGGLYLLSRRRGRTSRVSTSGVASGSITPYTPQAPVVVSPGESVYDPNTQGLINTPTANTAGNPPQTTAPSKPNYVVNVKYPPIHKTVKQRKAPAKRTISKRKHTKASTG